MLQFSVLYLIFIVGLLVQSGSCGHCDPPTGSYHYCNSYGDPHFQSFDGVRYSIQALGDYYLVREINSDFVVQVRQFSCAPNAACNGAVAIKYLDLTFYVYVDKATGSPAAHVVGDASIYNVKITNANGNSFYFVAPTGARVNITVNYFASQKVYYLDVLTSLYDGQYSKRVHGLCGAFDGIASNEFTLKNGTVLTITDAHATAMAASWQVPASEDLFNNAHCIIPYIFGALSSNGLPGSAIGCLPPPPSVPVVPDSPLENCTCQNGCAPSGPQPPSSNCLNFADPILYARAVAACTNPNLCCQTLSAGWNYTAMFNQCLCDYNLAKGPDFVLSSLNAYDQACQGYAQSVGKDCKICPNSCSGRGVCTNGVCICNLGAMGVDCHQDLVTCSVAISLSVSIITPGCSTQDINVFGQFFYGTNLQCRFGSSITVPATKISDFQVKCTVPASLSISPVLVYVLTQAKCQLSTASLIIL